MNISMESLFSVGGQGIRAEVVVRGIVSEFDGMVNRMRWELLLCLTAAIVLFFLLTIISHCPFNLPLSSLCSLHPFAEYAFSLLQDSLTFLKLVEARVI